MEMTTCIHVQYSYNTRNTIEMDIRSVRISKLSHKIILSVRFNFKFTEIFDRHFC